MKKPYFDSKHSFDWATRIFPEQSLVRQGLTDSSYDSALLIVSFIALAVVSVFITVYFATHSLMIPSSLIGLGLVFSAYPFYSLMKLRKYRSLLRLVEEYPAEICHEFSRLRDSYLLLEACDQHDEEVKRQKNEVLKLLPSVFAKALVAANMESLFYPVSQDSEALREIVSLRLTEAKLAIDRVDTEVQRAREELSLQ